MYVLPCLYCAVCDAIIPYCRGAVLYIYTNDVMSHWKWNKLFLSLTGLYSCILTALPLYGIRPFCGKADMCANTHPYSSLLHLPYCPPEYNSWQVLMHLQIVNFPLNRHNRSKSSLNNAKFLKHNQNRHLMAPACLYDYKIWCMFYLAFTVLCVMP